MKASDPREAAYVQILKEELRPAMGCTEPIAIAYVMPLVERLAPRGILLDHYDDAFPPMSATVDTAGFVTAAEKRLGIPCRALKKYETLTL